MSGDNATPNAGIVCETTACLPPSLVAELDIRQVAIPFSIADQEFLDGADVPTEEVYFMIREGRGRLKTSPPPPGVYLETWREAARNGNVIMITLNSRLSTLHRSVRLAQELAPEQLSGIRVHVIDSLSAGMGQGFVVLAAARAAAQGATVEAIVQAAKRAADETTMLVTLKTLEYVTRTSRLPEVTGFVGSLLPIQPIFRISKGGLHLAGQARTRQRAAQMLLQKIEALVPGGVRPRIAVQHAASLEEARQLEDTIRNRIDCEELFTTEFTPVMGGFAGPGLLGAAIQVPDHG